MKRAQLPETLLWAILFVIGTLILFWLANIFLSYLHHRSSIDACKASLAVSARANVGGTSLVKIKKNCPMEKVKYEYRDYGSNLEYLKRDIADRIKLCDSKTGNNKINFASAGIVESNTFCIFCSDLSFDERFKKEDLSIDILSFLKFKKPLDIDKTYLSYLNENRKVDESGAAEIQSIDYKGPFISNIKTSRDYYIVLLKKYSTDSMIFLISKEEVQDLGCTVAIK
jgi:hypothetical protein